jgi:hypothetical protein
MVDLSAFYVKALNLKYAFMILPVVLYAFGSLRRVDRKYLKVKSCGR